MKKLLFIAVLTVLGCSKASDPLPIAPLLGTWKTMGGTVSGCPSGNGPLTVFAGDHYSFTSIAAPDAPGYYKFNITAANYGTYKIKGDSILFYSTKGVYSINNGILTLDVINYSASSTCRIITYLQK